MNGKLLLHHCCAPCSPKVVEILRLNYDIESFWYNPNIHPADEYEKRLEAMKGLAALRGLRLHFGPGHSQEQWVARATEHGGGRCSFCYTIRLTETAKQAKLLGIERFSTTLLSSPHQKHDLIKEIGHEIARIERLEFVYGDFRPYFYEGRNEARAAGLYSQWYCGCIFSRQEREREIEEKKKRKAQQQGG